MAGGAAEDAGWGGGRCVGGECGVLVGGGGSGADECGGYVFVDKYERSEGGRECAVFGG